MTITIMVVGWVHFFVIAAHIDIFQQYIDLVRNDVVSSKSISGFFRNVIEQ